MEDDGTKGELTVGPGVGGIQPRWSECKRALPGLTLDQEERLKKAKRFAMEQSVQQVCNDWLINGLLYLLLGCMNGLLAKQTNQLSYKTN